MKASGSSSRCLFEVAGWLGWGGGEAPVHLKKIAGGVMSFSSWVPHRAMRSSCSSSSS